MSKWIKLDVPGPACEISESGLVRQKLMMVRGILLYNQVRVPTRHTETDLRYLSFRDPKTGDCQNRYIHRLVAENFIPNPDECKRVRFKTTDKGNTHKSNLEWV